MTTTDPIDPEKGPWILTASGRVFYFLHPEFHLADIANHLEGINRFTGAKKPGSEERITVAAHSLMVADLVAPKYRRHALMHDAVEAYINDCNSPLKTLIPDYCKLEKRLRKALSLQYDIDFSDGLEEIEVADKMTCDVERFLMIPESPHFNIDKVKNNIDWMSDRYRYYSYPGLFYSAAIQADIQDPRIVN